MQIGLIVDAFQGKQAKWGCGGNTYVAELYKNLSSAGLEISLWSYPSTRQALGEWEGEFVALNDSQPAGVWKRQIHTTMDLLAHRDALRNLDIVHSTSGSSVMALRCIANSNTRFVFDFRTPFINTQRLMNLYKKSLFRLFEPDWVMFVDPVSSRQYRELYHRGNCSYIPIATDLSLFQPRTIDNHNHPLRVLFAGVLRSDKGLEDLLEAMHKVWKQHPDVELLVAGYGPMRDKVERLSRDNKKLSYLGFVPHTRMPDLLNTVDIFVLPSYREGFSRAVLEALASGLPVITTSVGALSLLKVNGVAEVITPGCPELLAEAISKLLAQKDLRVSYGVKARHYAMENHTWEKVMKEIIALYSRIL